jgi:hypothetical protein
LPTAIDLAELREPARGYGQVSRRTHPVVPGGVAPELAADSGRTAIKSAGNLADADAVPMHGVDPLAFGHGQIPMGAHGFR